METLILKQPVDRLKTLAACTEIANRGNQRYMLAFRLLGEEVRGNVTTYRWLDRRAGTYDLVIDPNTGVTLVRMALQLKAVEDFLLSEAKEQLTWYSRAELRELVLSKPSGVHLTQYALGCATVFDPEILPAFEQVLKTRSVPERTAATMAAYLLQWPELASSLQSAAELEFVSELKAQMFFVADGLLGYIKYNEDGTLRASR
ncbi:MAG: hypothetical protein KC561_01125 [Myxococcales bacterium]|nr:hypothetical protein [Myxococcales bacterium]